MGGGGGVRLNVRRTEMAGLPQKRRRVWPCGGAGGREWVVKACLWSFRATVGGLFIAASFTTVVIRLTRYSETQTLVFDWSGSDVSWGLGLGLGLAL